MFGAISYRTASPRVQILLQQPNIDASRLAISGGDLALITAALTDDVHALQSGGLMFADIDNRISGDPDYPLAEFNDFKRTHPDHWNEAQATLANYDPMALASGIDANKVMLSAGASDKGYYDGLASALSGETTVRVNLGKGHLDHLTQEEWLAEACGIEPGSGALSEVVMEEFVAKEPLILFEIRKALSEGRVLPEAIEGWWENINPSNAEKRPLVTGESVGKDRFAPIGKFPVLGAHDTTDVGGSTR